MNTDLAANGGCQCGKIRYRLIAEPLMLYICHCSDCQKQSASAFGMSLRMRPREEKAGIIADFAATVMPLFERGRIAPVIDSLMPLEKVADAHRRMEASEHFGKIVLVMD